MATRKTDPIAPRDAATVRMANNCEGHVRILQEQRITAREMIHLAHDMVALATSMRKLGPLVLPLAR
jgi:hypothetical protein